MSAAEGCLPRVPVRRILGLLEQAYPEAHCALAHRDAFELLVATVLSAQCTDERVNRTTPALFARYPDAAALAGADIQEVSALISGLGLFRNKARNLLAAAARLVEHHGGQVPADMEALTALPGVGRKTANVVLSTAFGVPAIAVDTHVLRVANRIGLARGQKPELVERQLQCRLPRSAWSAAHHRLIWHGRLVCHARRPACATCPLREVCRYARTAERGAVAAERASGS